jgi:hypothetical protein
MLDQANFSVIELCETAAALRSAPSARRIVRISKRPLSE